MKLEESPRHPPEAPHPTADALTPDKPMSDEADEGRASGQDLRCPPRATPF
jgi:hypothetical protein